jgi:hypothetical protein
MNTPITQDLARHGKINLLNWRIQRVRSQLDQCEACTPESRMLMLKLVTLVQRRNSLHTPADVAAIEKSRGLA